METNPSTDIKDDVFECLSKKTPKDKYGRREIALTNTSTKLITISQEAKIHTFAKKSGKGGKPDNEKKEAKGENPRLEKQQQKSRLKI